MSGVSPESPRASADLTVPADSDSEAPARDAEPAEPRPPGHNSPTLRDFGPNEWLVDELYQRYLADPGSVDRAWWNFFADYQPSLPNGTGPQPVLPRHAPQAATQAPAAQAPAQAPAAAPAP